MKFSCILIFCFVTIFGVNSVTWPDAKRFHLGDFVNYPTQRNIEANSVNFPKRYRSYNQSTPSNQPQNGLSETQKVNKINLKKFRFMSRCSWTNKENHPFLLYRIDRIFSSFFLRVSKKE